MDTFKLSDAEAKVQLGEALIEVNGTTEALSDDLDCLALTDENSCFTLTFKKMDGCRLSDAEIRKRFINELYKLDLIDIVFTESLDSFNVSQWEDYTSDLSVVSAQLHNVLLTLSGHGEDLINELWKKYFLNGTCQHVDAIIKPLVLVDEVYYKYFDFYASYTQLEMVFNPMYNCLLSLEDIPALLAEAFSKHGYPNSSKDMIAISREIKDVQFVMSGLDESATRVWREYHLNGNYEFEWATISFDAFDRERLTA